jgi:hypothetical protein
VYETKKEKKNERRHRSLNESEQIGRKKLK